MLVQLASRHRLTSRRLICAVATALIPVLCPRAALAQAIPTELSVGAGAVVDSGQSSADFNVGLAWVYVRNQWLEPAIELGLGPTSDQAPCRDEGPLARPETCTDGYIVAGVRLRPLKESDRLSRPFVHVLLGGYWTGTGLKDPETLPGTFALQLGGGVDIRRPSSIHGFRLCGDYRRVFNEGHGRHQLQFTVSYFVGWRGAKPPQQP